ncbi:hypothetical protein BN903_183 [Halorubrum sp. AJ67]|nr:hypothetical protein BN903_183 [Halorubrum sp. AJ67]
MGPAAGGQFASLNFAVRNGHESRLSRDRYISLSQIIENEIQSEYRIWPLEML